MKTKNEWLVKHVPWTNAEHILSATNADGENAELLSLAERDTLFVIQLRTWHINFGDICLPYYSSRFYMNLDITILSWSKKFLQ